MQSVSRYSLCPSHSDQADRPVFAEYIFAALGQETSTWNVRGLAVGMSTFVTLGENTIYISHTSLS